MRLTTSLTTTQLLLEILCTSLVSIAVLLWVGNIWASVGAALGTLLLLRLVAPTAANAADAERLPSVINRPVRLAAVTPIVPAVVPQPAQALFPPTQAKPLRTKPQEFVGCGLCDADFDPSAAGARVSLRVISKELGGCDHYANLIDICQECSTGMQTSGALTPIEFWAAQEWTGAHSTEGDQVSDFDFGGWSEPAREDFLLRAARWEARARWHLLKAHGGIRPKLFV